MNDFDPFDPDFIDDELLERRERTAKLLSEMAKNEQDSELRAAFENLAARAAHPDGWGTAYEQLGIYRITDAVYANSRMDSGAARKLKVDDLVLCVKHSGDYFHDFVHLDLRGEYLNIQPGTKFGSYGGLGEKVGQLTQKEYLILSEFGPIETFKGLAPRPE